MCRITCEDFQRFIDPYLDSEFDERERADFDAHLAICEDCRKHFEQRAWFQEAIRPILRAPTPMPGGARARLRVRLATADHPSTAQIWLKRLAVPVPILAAAAAVFLMATPLTGFTPVVHDAVDQHCQSLPVEVPSPEAAEVDEWFEGKLPFHVVSPRFQDKDIVLLGGRLSRVVLKNDTRRAAYLIYGKGSHKLSVLVFDGNNLEVSGNTHQIDGHDVAIHDADGYRVALYRHGPLAYVITSDLPEDGLLNLVKSAF